ncbi:type II toxin-antitoxin system RelE/ParE family toxin [Acidisphaera sp. L21]|uniref:type II toxin-antitoxin system RelE/ParE family toxin n=1 Tax=Acidisphaera sp. L21 TaxID=1641851 RepID=UPI00131CA29D|nr:type II toxin-antitoxin system RelE/ParE family toxin [Acidisphaera sp. L21]
MSGAAILAPRARAELVEAVRYLAQDSESAARGLRLAVGEAARLIGARPLAGRERLELAPTRYRFWSLTRYPYILVYEAASRPPRIARCVHMARDLEPLLADLSD